MTEIEILQKYDDAVASYAALLATNHLKGRARTEAENTWRLFAAGRDAIREKQEREKGCEFCKIELEDYPYINACGDCDSSDIIYTPEFCPRCGRPLTET